MKQLKVMTIVGTRPEIIRLSCISKKLDKHCEHIVVNTSQNYDHELNKIFYDDLKIRKPDYLISISGVSASETIGNAIIKLDKLFRKIKPDAVLVLGDTNSCMAILSAKRLKIPTFHMEAGNRCYDMRVPEEINRRIIDHISDINLTYSTIARENLLAEGLSADRVIKVGSPMLEVLNNFNKSIKKSNILKKLKLTKKNFFLVSAHREENINSKNNFFNLIKSLNLIAKKFNLPVVISTHPRTLKQIKFSGVKFHPNIRVLKPLGFNDYNKLQISAYTVLSDSGTITEESSILNFPALNIRETHERHEGMEEAAVMMVGLNPERILQGIKIIGKKNISVNKSNKLVTDYDVTNVSDKIVKIIHSYVDYVNRVVWQKN